MNKRLAFLTSVGSGLEYYDFVIYALAAQYISQNFFPAGKPWLNLMNTLFIFASGYIVRPLGGMIFGSMGDRFGRKKSFTTAIFLMSMATLGIACLPSYEQWGLISSLLLLSLRLLQGIAQGAELPGALTFIFEHAAENKRGFATSLVTSGVGIGSMFGALVFFFLHLQFTDAQMQAYAWRIAFFLGGGVAFFTYLLRRFTPESPLFQAEVTSSKPIKHCFQFYWRNIITGISLMIFNASFVIYFLFIPNYLHRYYQYPLKTIYAASTIGLAWSAILIPIMGAVSDKVGSKRQLIAITALTCFALPALFSLLSYRNIWTLYFFVFCYQSCIAIAAACCPFQLANLFPTKVRYTGTALTYNIAFAFAGFIPLITAFMLHYFDSAKVVPYFFSLLALFSCLMALTIPKRAPV